MGHPDMSAFELLQRVHSLGGQVRLAGDDLQVTAPRPLPEDLLIELSREKPAVMVALGAPFDRAVGSILNEVRPHLPPALRDLSDAKLLVMVNWTIMAAWQKTLEQLSPGTGGRESADA
jgi:hypothetical protein